ncbi:hypothetical protein [Brachyspira intermedia]|uniref:hypothetical protein n=1 Tax=Brachyspira intermedia TaxID=84377 RepID=UPI0030067F0F
MSNRKGIEGEANSNIIGGRMSKDIEIEHIEHNEFYVQGGIYEPIRNIRDIRDYINKPKNKVSNKKNKKK